MMVLAACADDDPDTTEATDTAPSSTAAANSEPRSTTTTAPSTTSTTTAPAPSRVVDAVELPGTVLDAVNFAPAGPYGAGVRTLEGADDLVVEVWYPTTEIGDGETYSLGEWTPELVVALLGDRLPEQLTLAVRDAEPADDGRFPVAVFSHGAGSFRTQSAEIATLLTVSALATRHPRWWT